MEKSELEILKEQVSSLSERIEKAIRASVPAAFEKGKWYYNSGVCGLFNEIGDRNIGLSISGWTGDLLMSKPEQWRLATKEEIESALTKEAERRGYKYGVILDYPWGLKGQKPTFDGKNFYDFNTDGLFFKGVKVYSSGQWAEILKDEAIKIGGYEAKYSCGHVSFGCKTYSQSDISNLLGCMSRLDLDVVGVKGSTAVSRSEVQKILNGFK